MSRRMISIAALGALIGCGGGKLAGDASAGGTEMPPTCPATCDTPAGTVYTFATAQGVTSALMGLWQICPGSGSTFVNAPADAIGVEFGPAAPVSTEANPPIGGNMYYLVQGSSGPVRGAGFDYQLTYDVAPEGSFFQFDVHPTPNSGFAGSLRYSPCPQEFEVSGTSVNPGERAILVPF